MFILDLGIEKKSEAIKETIINELKDKNINYIDIVAKEIIIDAFDDKTITIPQKNLKKLIKKLYIFQKMDLNLLFLEIFLRI